MASCVRNREIRTGLADTKSVLFWATQPFGRFRIGLQADASALAAFRPVRAALEGDALANQDATFGCDI